MYIVHRAERLDDLFVLAHKYEINIKNVQFIATKENACPRIVLIKAVKNSNSGVKIGKMVCIANKNTYQNI